MRASILAFVLFFAACSASERVGETDLPVTSAPLIAFRGGSVQADGPLFVGTPIIVTYDVQRLSTCGTLVAASQSDVHLDLFALSSAGQSHVELGADWADAEHGIARAVLAPLASAGELELWVMATNASGCQSWDSADGQNYRFAVGERAIPTYADVAPLIQESCAGCHPQIGSLEGVRATRDAMLKTISSGLMPRNDRSWRYTDDGQIVLDFLRRSPELE